MIIRLVAQRDPQLLELLHSLAIDVQPWLYRNGWRIVPEDIAHVVEQAGHRQQQFRTLPLLLPFQNILGVGVTIRIRYPKAVPGCFFVFGDTVSGEVQLPQQIVRPGMIVVSGVSEMLRRFDCVLLYGLTCQVLLPQPVGSVGVSVLSCSLQPLDSIGGIMHLRIIREI